MSILSIDTNACKKCGICEQSCPISIIEKNPNDNFPFVSDAKESFCINCGHCESICPESALIHTLAQNTMKPLVEGNTEIDSLALGKYFRNRRSIRNYQPQTIDKKIFEEILDVVRYSPTGTNRQLNQWIIVSEKDIIAKLTEGTINWMRAINTANPDMAKRYNFTALIAAFENGIDLICRNAPHIVISYAPTVYPLGSKDTIIATSHMELLFPSYGIGSCWAGFLMLALQNFPECKKLVGLDDSSTVHAALMVGYPKYSYYKTPARKTVDVRWL